MEGIKLEIGECRIFNLFTNLKQSFIPVDKTQCENSILLYV